MMYQNGSIIWSSTLWWLTILQNLNEICWAVSEELRPQNQLWCMYKTRCPGATCRAHMSKHLYSLFDSVTLTFDIESRVLYWTHLHIIIVIILTKYHEYITIICKVIYHWQGKSHLWPLRVTLTFDIKSWILYATHLQIIVNIFTKYHEDTTTTY